jgi:hypothetical protein
LLALPEGNKKGTVTSITKQLNKKLKDEVRKAGLKQDLWG